MGNRLYDPNEAGTGSGRIFPERGINIGEYEIELNFEAADVNDVLLGTSGDDILIGTPENDFIFAEEGNDVVSGEEGDDLLSGDAGNDTVIGNAGDDLIMGVTGDDVIEGGSGSDTFIFGNGDGTDLIRDFHPGVDKIGLVEGELTFADLNFSQLDGFSLVKVTGTGETLAILPNTNVDALIEDIFVAVADISSVDDVSV